MRTYVQIAVTKFFKKTLSYENRKELFYYSVIRKRTIITRPTKKADA